jgi:hypothetical protein
VVGIWRQRVEVGQAKGPDVQLVVSGTELYATYETDDGYAAVHDDALGLFCFARVVDGAYASTGIPVSSQPPADIPKHATESDEVRARKIAQREAGMKQRSFPTSQQPGSGKE